MLLLSFSLVFEILFMYLFHVAKKEEKDGYKEQFYFIWLQSCKADAKLL